MMKLRGFLLIWGMFWAVSSAQAQDIVKCGTPAIIEAMRSGKTSRFEPMSTLATNFHLSPSGKFRLEYETTGTHAVPLADLNANGIPDYVEKAGQYADESWRVMVDSLGFVDPVRPGSPYRIRFQKMGSYGYTQPSGGTTFIVVHNDFIGSAFSNNDDPEGKQLGALKVTIAHELKHAIQFETSRWQGDSGGVLWAEMDATMMEEVVYPQVNDYVSYVSGSIFSNPTTSVPNSYPMASFSLYYHERVGPRFWVNVWNRIRLNNTLPMFTAMRNELGELFDEHYVGNHLWHHASGSRARSGYGFADRAKFATSASTSLASGAEVSVASIPRNAARYYRVVPSPSDSGPIYFAGYRPNAFIQFGMIAYLKDGSVREAIPVTVRSFEQIETYEMLTFDPSVRFQDVDLIGIVVVNTSTVSREARFRMGMASQVATIPYGDFNVDALVDERDLTDMLGYMVGKYPMNDSMTSVFRADLSKNGTLSALDAAMLFQSRLPSDANSFGRGPGPARFNSFPSIDGLVWLDLDPPFFMVSPTLTTRSVAQGDTILFELSLTGNTYEHHSWSGVVAYNDTLLALTDVKNRSLAGSAQRFDKMRDGKTSRFVMIQNTPTSGNSTLTLAFRALKSGTTTIAIKSGQIDERFFFRPDSVTIITNPNTPVGLESEPDVPRTLSLAAYPNPFNPSTEIRYRKSEIGRTRLAVFDILGREVRLLVNVDLPSGEHSVRFDAGNLSSGVYVVVLEADGQRLVRTMTLIK